ncbi:MAG: AAA family ATPase [Gammaproteobacteria bacterium]
MSVLSQTRREAEQAKAATLTLEQRATGTAPVVALSAQELIAREFPPREDYFGKFITSQSLGMVHAWRGIGKTHFGLEAAFAVASGGRYLKWDAPEARRVLYLDGEMPGAVLQERVARIAASAETEPPGGFLRFVTPDVQAGPLPDLATTEGQEQYGDALQGVNLIIVDNLSCLARRGGKENEAESWLTMADWALRQRAAGRAVMFIHHSGKGGAQRGTSRREDLLDWVIALRRPMDYLYKEGARFTVEFEKARGLVGDAVTEFEAKLGTDEHGRRSWTMANLEDAGLKQVAVLVKEGATQKDIADELGLTRFQAGRRIKTAIEAGLISHSDVRDGRTKRGKNE